MIFDKDIGSDLYFYNMNQNWAGRGTLDHPQGGLPKILKKNVLGYVTYQSKAHENLYSNKSIKCSFDHSFDHHQLKIIIKYFFFITVLLKGACPRRMVYFHNLNKIG